MPVTFKQALIICLTAWLFSFDIAYGQQDQSDKPLRQNDPTTLPSQTSLTPVRLFELASPAVVKLTIKDELDREIGIATGFILNVEKKKIYLDNSFANIFNVSIKPGFYDRFDITLITNYHAIRPAISIDVSLHDGQTTSASQVINQDESTDLAIILATLTAMPKRVLKLWEGSSLPVGTKIFAIGNPQGLSNTLSEGIISGYRKRGKHEPWIQITAPISPGSSGGPLLSSDGTVIGITTAFLKDSQNLNFAVPAKEISRLLTLPNEPRDIWEGASIQQTETYAFLFATASLSMKIPQVNQKDNTDTQSEQEIEMFLEKLCSEGNQLALLIKGRDLYKEELGKTIKEGEKALEISKSIDLLRRATEAEPGEYDYLTYYMFATAMRLKPDFTIDLEAAIKLLKRAKELNPEFGPTYYLLSDTYFRLKKYPEALIEAENLIRIMPRCYRGYQLRGESWANLGREKAFERDFETACELQPNDSSLQLIKGNVYLSLDNWQKAVETYKDAININKYDSASQYALGNVYQKMGKYNEAIKSFQRVLKLSENNTGWPGNIMERRIAECRYQMIQSP